MPAAISNPSFEQAGDEVGKALDWTYSTTSSLYEYGIFHRSDSTIVVDTVAAVEGAGITVTTQEDGTSFLAIALGKVECFESFEYGWKSNQFYELAFPTSNSEPFLISGAKHTEDFEDGWGVDANFTVKNTSTTTNVVPQLPRGDSLTINQWQGYYLEVNGQRRTITSNDDAEFTPNTAFTATPVAGTSLRVVGGSTNNGLLDDLDLQPTELQTEEFEDGWPWYKGLPADGVFYDTFLPIQFATISDTQFIPGLEHPAPEYSNSFTVLRTVPAAQDASVFGKISVLDKDSTNALYTFAEDSYYPSRIVDFVDKGSTKSIIQLRLGGFTDHSVHSTRNVIGRILNIGEETRKIVESSEKSIALDRPLNLDYPLDTRVELTLDAEDGTPSSLFIYAPIASAGRGVATTRPRVSGINTIRKVFSISSPVDQGTYLLLGEPGIDLARGFFNG